MYICSNVFIILGVFSIEVSCTPTKYHATTKDGMVLRIYLRYFYEIIKKVKNR